MEVHGTYRNQRVTGVFDPGARRLTVTSGPVAGRSFKSPSAAVRAVIAAANPARVAAQSNGWRFWHVTATGERLDHYR